MRCHDSPANSVLAGAATGALLYKSHGEHCGGPGLGLPACLPACSEHGMPSPSAPISQTLTSLHRLHPVPPALQASRACQVPSSAPRWAAPRTCCLPGWMRQAACSSCSSASTCWTRRHKQPSSWSSSSRPARRRQQQRQRRRHKQQPLLRCRGPGGTSTCPYERWAGRAGHGPQTVAGRAMAASVVPTALRCRPWCTHMHADERRRVAGV